MSPKKQIYPQASLRKSDILTGSGARLDVEKAPLPLTWKATCAFGDQKCAEPAEHYTKSQRQSQ